MNMVLKKENKNFKNTLENTAESAQDPPTPAQRYRTAAFTRSPNISCGGEQAVPVSDHHIL